MDKNRFHSHDNKFFEEEILLINAPASIKKFLIINNLIVLLLDSDNLNNDNNVLCYDLNGKFKWQIEEVAKLHDKNYFTSIYINDNNEFQAYNLNGIEVTINLITGSIIKKELIK